jgi:hypothetical protein
MTRPARAAVFHLLTHDDELHALGIDVPNTYQTNAVDNPETRPFLVIRWEAQTMAFESVGPQSLVIWAHDERGDYSRIDSILERSRMILVDANHILGDDGVILTTADYMASSDDLWDDGYRTIARNCTFRTLSREV